LNTSYLTLNKPFTEPSVNRLEIFNELCISLMGYTLITFTDFIEATEIREITSYFVIGIVAINFAVNIGMIVKGMIQKIKFVV
jgi:hypothetical protein